MGEEVNKTQTQATEQTQRPNRDKYASMFVEDNPDVDFEDKEARYGRLAEERENYRTMKKSGAGLSKALDRNRWLGSMFKDLAENPEKNPLVWLVENGIDVKAALDDPKVMEEVDEKFKNWQQKQVDGENAEKTQNDNIRKSLEALSAVQQKMGISDEQFDRMWEHFWNEVFAPAFNGEVSEETWTAILHAMNYDQDIADAREEAAMQARNEKFANKVKTYEESRVPPSFSAGRPLHTQTQKPKKEKSLADFIKENG